MHFLPVQVFQIYRQGFGGVLNIELFPLQILLESIVNLLYMSLVVSFDFYGRMLLIFIEFLH